MKYLGLPIRAHLKAQAICDGVLKRMKKRLPGWKSLLLIQGGRFTLIKRMLKPSHLFHFAFSLPARVANVMEKIFIKKLWGGMGEEFKFHLVNWNSICKPIQQGCSGIRNCGPLTKPFLWNGYGGTWWRRILYGEKPKCDRFETWKLSGLVWVVGFSWCEPLEAYSAWVDCFLRYIWFEVRYGTRVCFWHDCGCGELGMIHLKNR